MWAVKINMNNLIKEIMSLLKIEKQLFRNNQKNKIHVAKIESMKYK